MEKLIELLNKYQRETKKAELYDFYIRGGFIVCDFLSTVEDYGYVINSRIEMDYGDEILISKSFGFIEWLVENEKIDLGKIKKLYRKSNEHSIHTYPIMYEYSDYESLLMLLAIQNEPIEFLVSILK